MTRFIVLTLLSALLAGCVVVPAGYYYGDGYYHRGYYGYGYGYSNRSYYRDHGQ